MQNINRSTNQSRNPRHPPLARAARLIWLVPLILAPACIGPHSLRGGHAVTRGPVPQSLAQGDNPSAPTRQSQDTVRTRTYTLTPSQPQIPTPGLAQPQRPPAPRLQSSTTPLLLTEREETHATTELGAAQKDTAREAAAKLASLKPITWVGLALFVFGLASLFWPPLQTIIGSLTTSAAITAGGIALIVLPTLIVGNELPILGGVAVAVALWFLAHRHGHLRGQLAATTPHQSTTNSQRNPRPPGTPPSAPAPSPNL
jgi:hypothetical protein